MEGRVWAMLGAFLFIACFAGVVSYYFEIDSKRKDWATAQADLKSVQQSVIVMDAQAASARKNFEETEADTSTVEKLIASKKELQAAVKKLQQDREAAVAVYQQSVKDLRNASVGTTWPEFTLGIKTYRGIRIKSISDTEVTFSHDEGVAKLNKDTLPEDVRDRFRIELFPMLPEPPAEKSMPQEVAAVMPVVVPAPASVVVEPRVPAGANAIAKLQIEIDTHEQSIATLEMQKQEWIRRAHDYRQQASNANFVGRPSYAFNQQASQAERNVDLATAHMEKLRRQILVLRKKQLDPATASAQ